jgi:predicted dehydrogenase
MTQGVSRRRFLKHTTAAGAVTVTLPCIVPASALGRGNVPAPSSVTTVGTVGCGNMGLAGHVRANRENHPPTQVAVCDVDANRLTKAMAKAGPGCKAYRDWRDVIDRRDIDIVHIATPPHWHGLIALAAVQAGKDVYCEKPLTRTIYEGQRLTEAVERYRRILHVNTHGRQKHNGAWLKKAIDANLLGSPVTVRVRMNMPIGNPVVSSESVPPELDYEMWLGPAPWRPYSAQFTHRLFRWYWDYDGGQMTDMGQHYFDPVQRALGKDDEFPVEVEASAPPPHHFAVGPWHWVHVKYADGTTIVFETEGRDNQSPLMEPGVIAQGPKGRFLGPSRTGHPTSDPPELADRLKQIPNERDLLSFGEAVKTRNTASGKKPNAFAAHHSCTVVNMANIAIRLGRPLRFDPATQRFFNDEGANALVRQPMRRPWHM